MLVLLFLSSGSQTDVLRHPCTTIPNRPSQHGQWPELVGIVVHEHLVDPSLGTPVLVHKQTNFTITYMQSDQISFPQDNTSRKQSPQRPKHRLPLPCWFQRDRQIDTLGRIQASLPGSGTGQTAPWWSCIYCNCIWPCWAGGGPLCSWSQPHLFWSADSSGAA